MTQKQKKDFVTYVKRVRQAIPMSLRDFAEAIGISFQTAYRWEAGRVQPGDLLVRRVRPKVEGLAKQYKVNTAA